VGVCVSKIVPQRSMVKNFIKRTTSKT